MTAWHDRSRNKTQQELELLQLPAKGKVKRAAGPASHTKIALSIHTASRLPPVPADSSGVRVLPVLTLSFRFPLL